MVLKNAGHTGDFCQEIDADEDSSSTLLASEWRRGQKCIVQDSDGSSNSRRADDSKEDFCSQIDKDDRSGSCETDLVNNLGQGGEAGDLRTNSGSPSLDYDMEDRQLESKHSQFPEATIQRLCASPSKFHGQNEKVMRSSDATESDEKCEPSVETSPVDDVDESDVEEEDVKVCDICGDAGREDLLAVCSRCTDGAEHTYCMNKMLDKVPEGDWLCEECQFIEDLEARRQEPLKQIGTTERSRSLGRTASINSDLSPKLDSKDSFCERSKLKNVSVNKQLPSKRSGDNNEAGHTSKRQVLESSSGSPTALSPTRVPVLSKDFSFKNSDRAKGKSTNQFSTGAESAGDSSENPRSPTRNPAHNLKGNLLKSNSFSSTNSKANVKFSEEVVQKHKQCIDAKDGPGKFGGKSMSFKGLGRSSVSEPKVKMLSPKCAPVQELKGQKQVRDRNSFERKNTIKSDHSFPVQTAANSTKRLPRVDNTSTLSVSNSRDYKNAQSDGKLTSLSKQAYHVAHKSQDAMVTLGEVKRASSTSIRGLGTSSIAEAKPNHVGLKDGPTLNSSRLADGSLVVSNGVKADLHDYQSEKAPENTSGRSRQGVNGALASARRGISSDASLLRAKDGAHEENKLKAALEAAMQKKQNIFKKNKMPEKLNDLIMSNIQGTHVVDAVFNQAIDLVPEEAIQERDAGHSNHTSISGKQTSIKQSRVYPADFVVSSTEDSALTVNAIPEQEAVWQGGFEIQRNGKLPDFCGGFQAHLSSFASANVLETVRKFPKKIVLSEVSRPCAWPLQFKEAGAREDNIAVYFFAKDPESYLRSYKILLEYMIKHDLALKGNINGIELLVFPSNHLAHRSQRWNTLFFMWGVFRGRRVHCPDDRCASLEKPEMPVSVPSTVCRVKDVASATCLSVSTSLQKPAIEDLSASGSDAVVSRSVALVSDGSSLQKSGSLSNGDCYDQGFNVGKTCLGSPTSQGNLEERPRKHSSAKGVETSSETGTAVLEDHCQLDPKSVQQQHSTQETDSSHNLQEHKKSLSDHMLDNLDTSSHPSKVLMVGNEEGSSVFTVEGPCMVNNNVEKKSENSLKQEARCVDIHENGPEVKFENIVKQEEKNKDFTWKNDRAGLKTEGSLKQEHGCVDIEENGLEVKCENIVKQEEKNKDFTWENNRVGLKREGSLKQERYVDINVSADDSMEDLHILQCSPKRHSEKHSAKPTSEAASIVPCQKRPWVDRNDVPEGDDQSCISKRIKGADDFYGCDLRRFPNSFDDRFAAEMHDVSTSSRIEDTSNKVTNEKATSVNLSAERCFFLMDTHAAQNASEDHSSPWKVSLLGNEDRLPDGSPNLELALGVEKKQSRKGVLPFFAGIVDRKGPDRPPDISSPKEEDEDPSASLSLSLAFPFSDMESPGRSVRPLTTVEQALPARHEANTSLLFFRGSSGK